MRALLDGIEWEGRLFNGDWKPAGAGVVAVTEKATGEVLGALGVASPDDVAEAAAAAAAAQPAWAATPGRDRARTLRAAAGVLRAAADEVRDWIVRESGSTRAKADNEIDNAEEELLEAAALATQPPGLVLAVDAGQQSTCRRVPLGVVGVITPWNVPLLLALRSTAPALATGNAVVLKPDKQTAVCGGLLLARIFEEAGLPPGVLSVLPGGEVAGEAVVVDPNVAMVSFTGSTEVGRAVGRLAGGLLKKVSLELGGNNAYVVLDDADVEAATSGGAWASFVHQGQVCMAAGRHVVHEAVAERYVARLTERAAALPVGDPYREDVALGPLINEVQHQRVDRIVRQSVEAGARLCTGGAEEGLFFRPTVLDAVTPDMPAFAEEIFGPVAPVTVVRDEDEAVAVANDTPYGLVASVYTSSPERGAALAARLRAGMVHVNDQTVWDEAGIPFGGVGASGNGSRFGAVANWETFTQWQWVTQRATQATYPF